MVGESLQLKTKVFVSYSRKDEAFAKRLTADLEMRGIEVFRDVDDTVAGEEWWLRLRSLIAAADTVVFVLSSRSMASDVCRDEVDYASSLNKRIFPSVIEDVEWASVPPGLAARHSVFFKDETRHAESIDQLVAALLTDLDWVREHTRLLERAQAWQANARGSHELLSGRGLEAAERWMAAKPTMAETPTALHYAFIKASRDAATRRRTFLLAGMAAALLFSISLAGLALWQRQVADEQRKIAEASERQAQSERDSALLTQSRFLAQAATQSLARGDAGTGMALALEALPDTREGTDRPYAIDAEIALFNAQMGLQERAVTPGGGWAMFSPDGTQVVTMLSGGPSILDAKSLRVVTQIKAPDFFPSAALSPDGQRILTVYNNGTARISDTTSGEELMTLRGHRDSVTGGDFSPDGQRLVTISFDGTARIWDAKTGESLLTLIGHDKTVTSAAFSPDGSTVATASWDGTARIWNAATGKEIMQLRSDDRIADLSFSPDGRRLVTASLENTARIWNVQTGALLHVLTGHTDFVVHARFSGDGSRVITASYDGTARIWDAESGTQVGVIAGHQAAVSAADFSPDGTSIVTAGSDRTLRMWSADPGGSFGSVLRHDNVVESASFSPDSRRLLTWTSEVAEIWDLETTTVLSTMTGKRLRDVALDAEGRRVLGLVDNEAGETVAKIWDADTGETLFTLEHYLMKDAAFSWDGKRVATISYDKTVQVWNADTGELAVTLKGHRGSLDAVVWSPDDSRIATISGDNTLRIWNSESGATLTEIPAKSNPLWLLAQPYLGFTPDGRFIIIASYDSTVHVWNAATGDLVHTLADHRGILDGLSISPSGDRMVTLAQNDKAAYLWDVAKGAVVAILDNGDAANSAAFSPDGKRVVTASWDGKVRIWDSETGQLYATLSGHQGNVLSAQFSADGKHVATASVDRTARVWRVFDSVQDLVDAAKQVIPRCLTSEQRASYFLDPLQPRWCGRLGKWPSGQRN